MKKAGALALSLLLAGCQAGMAASPEAARINLELGAAYLDQGRVQLARDKLIRATKLDPHSAEAHRVLGMVYERLGNGSSAEEHYVRAVRLAPVDAEALNSLGVFRCRQSGETEQGLRFLSRAAKQANADRKPDIYANCGLCELALDRSQAAKWFRLALELDPGHSRARRLLDRIETQH